MKTSGFRFRRGLVAVAGAVALGLAGCGDDAGGGTTSPSGGSSEEKGASALDAVQLAASTSEKAESANFTMDMDMTVGGQSLPVSAKGKVDGVKNVVEMTMSMEVPGQGAMNLKQVMADDTIYMSGIPGMGKSQWVKMSLDEMGAMGGGATGGASSLGSGDPTDQLKMLSQVSEDVKEDGKETINGVETTKYTGTIDLQKAAAASGTSAEDLKKLQAQYKEMGLQKIPFSLFVDDENLPARMQMSFDGKVENQPMKMNMKMDFTKWGEPVKITVPKKAQSFEEMLQGLGAGAGATP